MFHLNLIMTVQKLYIREEKINEMYKDYRIFINTRRIDKEINRK